MEAPLRGDVSALRLLALVGAVSVWMGLGRLHYLQDSDSLVPVLVSLQRWTPFYWGQDRFGMLTPLLAMPIRDPLANLLVQGWLATAAALLAPFLVVRYLDPKSNWFAAGALANALLLLVLSLKTQFDWLVAQPYGLSISLAFFGLLVAERRGLTRAIAGAALLLLAHWVNIGILLMVLPCVLVRARVQSRHLVLIAIGFVGGVLLTRLSIAPPTPTRIVPLTDWPAGWLALLSSITATIAHPFWFAPIVALALLGATFLSVDARSRESSIRGALMAMIVAVAYWLIVGTFGHVQGNVYSARYIFPSFLLVGLALAIPIVSLVRRPQYAATCAAALFVTVSVLTYGTPSLKRLNRTIERAMGLITPDVIATKATIVVGDYWKVWPSVFHANLVLYRNTGTSPVFGLTYRSDATDDLWSKDRRTRRIIIAEPNSREIVQPFFTQAAVPITFVEYRGPLAIFVTGAPSSSSGADTQAGPYFTLQ